MIDYSSSADRRTPVKSAIPRRLCRYLSLLCCAVLLLYLGPYTLYRTIQASSQTASAADADDPKPLTRTIQCR